MAESTATAIAADWSKVDACATSADTACATTMIQKLGRRLYRRALTDRQNPGATKRSTAPTAPARPAALVTACVSSCRACCSRPAFLYLVEPAAPNAGAQRLLSPFELATRLAAFVWNSTPDDALLDAAAAGKLESDDAIRAQVDGMLADARASSTIRSFHRQWLGLDAIAAISKDPTLFPGFGDDFQRNASAGRGVDVRRLRVSSGGRQAANLVERAVFVSQAGLVLDLWLALPGTPFPTDSRRSCSTRPSARAC